MRYLILGLAVAAAAILTLVFLEPFGGSDRVEDAVVTPAPVDGRWATICSQPLAPIGQEPITKQNFEVVAAGIDSVISAAEQGDLNSAQAAFFSKVHDFTHDIDASLRAGNPDLAQRLCGIVGQMEEGFFLGAEAATIAAQAAEVSDMLKQAADELEFGE